MTKCVVLSAGNISHYHHTALALQKAGLLHRYLCVFSGRDDFGKLVHFLPRKWKQRLNGKSLPGLNAEQITTIPMPYLVAQSLRRSRLISSGRANALFSAWYDRASLKWVEGADIFYFVNSVGLRAAQKVRVTGGITICDVRAEHVDTYESILRDEYDRLGLPYHSTRALYRDRLIAEYELADEIIIPSEYVAETFIQQGVPAEKLHVIPYGVDLSRFSAWQLQQDDITDTNNVFQVLYVGQVIPRKGLHYLIQAMENLALPKSELLIIGHADPDYLALLKNKIDKLKVRFLGHIPQTELRRYYQSSDVFVLPTLSEGSALVVYEAMGAGLSILATSNAGSVIQDGVEGYVVPIRDVSSLEEKLLWLYKNPEARAEMGHQAAQHIKQFTWQRYGERLLQVYGEILEKRHLERI